MRTIALRFDASIPRDWEPVIWKACAAWEKSGKVKFVAISSKEIIYFDRAILGNGQLAYRRPASETSYNVITFNVSKRLSLATSWLGRLFSRGDADLLTVSMHEIGHVLIGEGHNENPSSIMQSSYLNLPSKPSNDDFACILI